VSGPDQYTMLMTSLPHHVSLFASTETPLGRIKLQNRLRMLDAEDAEQLRLIVEAVRWRLLQKSENDAAALATANRNLPLIESPLLRHIVRERLELRTVVAALRRRQRGDPSPGPQEQWGFGRWVPVIRANWADPAFRLESAYRWLPDANRLLRDGDALGLERLLLGTLWDQLGQASQFHFFDFEAVVIYVLRWDLIARWTSYNAQKATRRFAELMDEGLGNAVKLFDQEVPNGQQQDSE
jgi:hypothetical protein